MELDNIKQVANGVKSMGEDYKQEKEEKEGEAQNATTAEKSNEESSKELAKEGADFAERAVDMSKNLTTGNYLTAIYNGGDFLR